MPIYRQLFDFLCLASIAIRCARSALVSIQVMLALRQQRCGRRLDADDEGENDRSLTATDTNLIAQRGTPVRSGFANFVDRESEVEAFLGTGPPPLTTKHP